MPDALIIGAGPAGTTAGIFLSRAGWNVRLVEQHRFPRDKVCGECLSTLGYDVLKRLGVQRRFHLAGAVELKRTHIHVGDAWIAANLPRPMWGLSRAALDALLLVEFASAGGSIVLPVRCESICDHNGRPGCSIRDLQTNRVTDMTSAFVLVADGKGVFADKSPSPTGDFGIKAHFEHIAGPRDAIELFGVDGSYGGLAAIENDMWNAAFSVPGSRLKQCGGNMDALFAAMMRENAVLTARLRNARRVSDWLAAPLPRFGVQTNWPGRVISIGNAAAAIEPIGGEGMGLAMRSGEIAAMALIRAGEAWSESDATALFAEYRRLWNVRRPMCRAAGRVVSSPGCEMVVAAAGSAPGMIDIAMRLMGKSAATV